MKDNIDQTQYELTFANLPASFHGCRMGFLSDLHNEEIGEQNCILLEKIKNSGIHYLFCGGDMIVGRDNGENEIDKALVFMDKLSFIAPVYYSLGNHEERLRAYMGEKDNRLLEYEKSLKDLDIHVLDNDSEKLVRGNGAVTVAGLSIGMEYYKRWYNRKTLLVGDMTGYLSGRPDGFTILLAHNPVYFDTYDAYGADLILSGHIHGGLVILPGIGGTVSPEHLLFPHYDFGHFQGKRGQMVISRGLGAHTLPIRFNNRPELVILTLWNADLKHKE